MGPKLGQLTALPGTQVTDTNEGGLCRVAGGDACVPGLSAVVPRGQWDGGGGSAIRLLLSLTLAVVRTVVPSALGLPLISGNLGIVCELAVFLPANSSLKHTRVKGFVCIWLGPSCRMRAVSLFFPPSIERWVLRLRGDRGTAEMVKAWHGAGRLKR